jgi:acyl-CoA reductase-like NAD-dependent aldehyde dehydrogenase
MAILHEEIFDPVTAILPCKDKQSAIELANDSPHGPSAGLWTRAVKRAHRLSQALEPGVVWINDEHPIDL